jgi:hypothetical protein
MKVYAFELNGVWLNNYVKCGLTADGGVRVRRTKDVATGKESWDVLVEFTREGARGKRKGWKEWVSVREMKSHATDVGRYGLFARGRFERGDVISVKRMADESETGNRVTGVGSVGLAGPTEETVGLGADWAATVDLLGVKKAVTRCCNARFTMGGRTLQATTRILPGVEIVVGVGLLPIDSDPWRELGWLDVLVWGGEVGIEGRHCIGRVTKFNKSSGKFVTRFEDGRVVPMGWEMVECSALHFEDGRVPQTRRPQKKR